MSKALLHREPEATPLRALVVDDDIPICKLLRSFLENLSLRVDIASNGVEAMELVRPGSHDLILLDLMMPVQDGLQTLRAVRRLDNDVFVLVMTGYGTIEKAVEAMKLGADEFLAKPLSFAELRDIVERERMRRKVADRAALEWNEDGSQRSFRLVTHNETMLRLLELVKKIAPLPITVLIQGESGTGKELIARTIHRESGRSEGDFVAINCGAIPEHLLESELFGYERGAFTGATNRKAGLFEAANGGTILLDEIGEMSANLQVKLLRVIQERSFTRLGGTKETPFDARIIASTNRDLQAEVNEGRFRSDLFYRINVVTMVVPPLRERPDDIELLSVHFLSKYAREFGKDLRGIELDAMELLMNHSWSGNVRELENVVERAVAVCERGTVGSADLPAFLKIPDDSPGSQSEVDSLEIAKQRFEKEYLRRILKQAKGNVSLAARLTRIARQNLYEKLEKYTINPDEFRTS